MSNNCRQYEVYANTDITLTTETGEIIFLPYGALLDEYGSPYYNKVTIQLVPYSRLLTTLSMFSQQPRHIHSIQMSSADVQCLDARGQPLRLNSYAGYSMLVFMPALADSARYYGNIPLTNPADLVLAPGGSDSFRVRFELENLPLNPGIGELQALALRKPVSDTADIRGEAALALAKLNSMAVLKNYLSANWSLATGNFIASGINGRVEALRKKEDDHPVSVPYFGFNIQELYDVNAKTGLLKIFRDNMIDFQQSLVIIDWTGSMHSHRAEIEQLVDGMELKKMIRHLVLYNDNPDPDFADLSSEKGFFWIDSVESFKQVKNLMDKCERDHCGGANLEESDYSALIRATSGNIPQWRSAYKQVIMLVDNNAPPRDSLLLHQISVPVPVHVIAFGANDVCQVQEEYHRLVEKGMGKLFAEGGAFASAAGVNNVAMHVCSDPVQEKRCQNKKK